MKKLIHWFPALIIGLFIFSGCDNDLELNADSKDIPVVYGMFSLQDSAYYLRVERVFLEPGEDALELAQQPGQLYYDNILVQLKRSNPEKTVAMERVDGNQEGYKRDEGIFAAAPNYLYKAKASDLQLSAGQTLTLEIDRGEGLPLVTAQTILVETPVWRTTVPSDPINWESGKVTRFSWSYGPETAFFDFRIRVRYEETLPTNPGQKEEKQLEWLIDDAIPADPNSTRHTAEVEGEAFFRFMGSAIPVIDGAQRKFISMNPVVIAGGKELAEFIRIKQANTGLTGSELVPTYTNLSEGLGLFTSKSTASRGELTLTPPTRDSLRNGQFTKTLNFQ